MRARTKPQVNIDKYTEILSRPAAAITKTAKRRELTRQQMSSQTSANEQNARKPARSVPACRHIRNVPSCRHLGATTCRRPGRARPRVWWMALSRWYPSGSRSTGWPPPRHSHYQPRHLPGTFLSAVGGGAPRAGSTQQALSGAGTFGRARAPGRRPVLGAPQS